MTAPANISASIKLPMPRWEFVCMVASLMALNAFAIDIMLPAMGIIGEHYGVTGNQQQWLLYSYLIGFGAPQLLFGPISDRFGRKNLLRICLVFYAIFGLACMLTHSFALLLLMRFLQGIFSSGVRVIAVSIVRDLTAGRGMAKIMSLVMTIFMIIPIIAPAVGQGVMMVAGWEWMFGVLGIAALMILVWVQLRLPETLKPEDRSELSFKRAGVAFKSVLTTRMTFGYMAASGVIFGALFAFIAAAEQIFDEVFGVGKRFAIWFAIIAGTLAVANFANSMIVERFGMRRISHIVLILFTLLAFTNFLVMTYAGEKLIYFLPLFALTFACFGMLGANFSAIAMEPQGKVAGTASAVYGFSTTTVASGFGYLVSSRFDGSVAPILLGFVGLGLLSLTIILITERGILFERAASRGGRQRAKDKRV
ncbi:multidrug effflux MFS transporter [Litorimonas sp. RW-G-Af-16]|uniref:multidrug effflux MFS transporter n=1 Tax=Litorimonas sp. RW-G-Af-16 TaxID=3241168 RepID=UPI00390C5C23